MTGLFIFNPMILYFGGNGMSEALYLFTMLAATRYLLRWLRLGDLSSLVYTGVALAFAYLERSEPVAAAALSTPLVLFVAFRRAKGSTRNRVWSAITDITILLMPIVTAFVGWAVVSYVITGEPFQQFSSKYGNSSLIANAHQLASTMSQRLTHELKAITYMSPLLALILIIACVVAFRRRDTQILGIIAILGAGLGFTLASYLSNSIFPWFRYYIIVAPLAVLLVGTLFGRASRVDSNKVLVKPGPSPRGPRSALGMIGAVLVAVLLLGPSLPGAAFGMRNTAIAPDVVQYAGYIFHSHLDADDVLNKGAYSQVVNFAHYIDSMHLPNGDIVVDNANSCIPNVYTNSDNPRVFVIHNDRDFQRTLDDPLTFHTHYMIVGSGSQFSDAVAQQYPNLKGDSTWVHLVHVFNFSTKGYCDGFKLYRVTGHPNGTF